MFMIGALVPLRIPQRTLGVVIPVRSSICPSPVQITSVAYASWCDLHLVKICARCFRLQAGHSQPVRGMLRVAATAHCIIISSIIVTKPASGGQNNLT